MGQLQYTRKNGKEENKENYDKEELVMIYLNQKHDTTKKYFKHDEVLMPLVVFLNNWYYVKISDNLNVRIICSSPLIT